MVITCLYSCEKNKSKSYCISGILCNRVYIAYAETKQTKIPSKPTQHNYTIDLFWLYYKLRYFLFFLIAFW